MVGGDVGRTGWPSQRWRADDATGLRRGIPTRRGARQLAAASIGPSLAGQTADVACRHGAQLARPSAAEARTRPPLGGQARRRGVQTGVGLYRGTGTRRCRPPATAYPARRGCWHHGARWTSWTSSGCRRTVGWCSLFGGRTTNPRLTARDQRRDVETRERRGRVPRICRPDVSRHRPMAPP